VSDGREDFFARWSRRKREAAREREAPAEPVPETASTDASEEPALSPEELAALPKIEDITPDTDITAFLKKGVPEALRNAALRRVWSLDPAIRDYVGDARDYAWDWNVVGGVPGNGPLLPVDDVNAMLRTIFQDGKETIPERAAPDVVADVSPGPAELGETKVEQEESVKSAEGDAAAQHPDAGAVRLESSDRLEIQRYQGFPGGMDQQDAHVAVPSEPGPAPAAAPPRRRHGGARPV
jgi:hypothetical protein